MDYQQREANRRGVNMNSRENAFKGSAGMPDNKTDKPDIKQKRRRADTAARTKAAGTKKTTASGNKKRRSRPVMSARTAYYMKKLGINSRIIAAAAVLVCIIAGCSIGIFCKGNNAAGAGDSYGTFGSRPADPEATETLASEAASEAVDETVYESMEDYSLWKDYTPEDKEKVRYVLMNKSRYNDDLIEKIKTNEELVDYVYNYPEEYGRTHTIDISGEVTKGQVPLFIQWDKRWGYIPYGSGLIGYTACGPTCISMVSVYYTGNTANTPDVVAAYAENNGYYVDGKGTAWSFMTQGCENFGIKGREIGLNEETMISELEQGRPIICIMDKGIFTTSGHFIVITGYRNGEFVVNDPNSPEKSAKTWSYDEIHDQISNLWSYEKLE